MVTNNTFKIVQKPKSKGKKKQKILIVATKHATIHDTVVLQAKNHVFFFFLLTKLIIFVDFNF